MTPWAAFAYRQTRSTQALVSSGARLGIAAVCAALLVALAVTAGARRLRGAVSEGLAQAAERGPGGEASLVPPDLDSVMAAATTGGRFCCSAWSPHCWTWFSGR